MLQVGSRQRLGAGGKGRCIGGTVQYCRWHVTLRSKHKPAVTNVCEVQVMKAQGLEHSTSFQQLLAAFQAHSNGFLAAQSPLDGRWHNVMTEPDSFLETRCLQLQQSMPLTIAHPSLACPHCLQRHCYGHHCLLQGPASRLVATTILSSPAASMAGVGSNHSRRWRCRGCGWRDGNSRLCCTM